MERLLKKVYSSSKAYRTLLALSAAASLLTAAAYLFLIIWVLRGSVTEAVLLIALTALPFFAVTAARRLINAPRPFELYSFYEKKSGHKGGVGFPSRHAFSAFIIATVSLPYIPAMGIALFALGIALCTARVLTGLHFIRDVIAGCLVGIVSGVLGILILSAF